MRTRMGALGLLAPLLLLGAACSDDDGDEAAAVEGAIDEALDEAASGAPATDLTAPEPPPIIDTCPLLEPAEIEAQYGERGTVAAGEPELGPGSCRWEVGDILADGGWVFATHYPVAPGMAPEEALEMTAGGAQAPERVDGLGDAAIVSDEGTDVLVWVLHGSDVLAVSSRFEQPVPGSRDRVLALAELADQRL